MRGTLTLFEEELANSDVPTRWTQNSDDDHLALQLEKGEVHQPDICVNGDLLIEMCLKVIG